MNAKIKFEDLAVVVLSSEDYKYLWSYFVRNFNKFFIKNKIEKFIITTNCKKKLNNFFIISAKNLDKHSSWSIRMSAVISKLKQKNLLVFTDDCFLIDYVNSEKFIKAYNHFKKKNIDHLRMYIETGYKKKNNINFLSYYNFHRLSLQPGLWKRSFFLKMLKKAIFNPRQFEEIGSILTKKKDKIYAISKPVFHYIEFIRMGKLTPEGKNYLKKKYKKIPNKFVLFSLKQLIIYYFKELKGMMFYNLPEFIKIKFIKKKLSGSKVQNIIQANT